MPKQTVTQFTIDRSKWLRGALKERAYQHPVDRLCSVLKDKEGQQCCLGFYLEACGVGRLTNLASPEEVKRLPKQAQWLIQFQKAYTYSEYRNTVASDACVGLMNANDNPKVPIRKIEARVRKLFAQQGIQIKFVGKTPRPV